MLRPIIHEKKKMQFYLLLSMIFIFSMFFIGFVIQLTYEMPQTKIIGVNADDYFEDGDGTEENPLQISSKEQLYNLATLINDPTTNPTYTSLYYELTTDIIFASDESEQWTPIGISSSSLYNFSGHFNGNGHIIINLTVTSTSALGYSGNYYCGLFGYVKGLSTSDRAEIKNLGLIGTNINVTKLGDALYSGSIAGYTTYTDISNCYNTGSIISSSSYNRAGGIAGYSIYTDISNCYNTGDVTTTSSASSSYGSGGIVGYARSTINIGNCYNTGDVTSNCSASSYGSGGIVGYAYQSTQITNCYNVGFIMVSGTCEGGIVGYSNNSDNQINNCYALENQGYTAVYGGGSSPSVNSGNILTFAEMMDQSLFINWDFAGETSIWTMAGIPFPILRGLTRAEDIYYSLTYNLNYSVSTDIVEFYKAGTEITLPEKTKVGYIFSGWSLIETDPVDYNVNSIYVMPSENITLYGQWVSYFAGGDGTEGSPFQIENKEQLYSLANFINNSTTNSSYRSLYYELIADITFASDGSEQWIPIGISSSTNYYFSGKFNGNGHTITNLTITSPIDGFDYYGLFGYVKSAEIKNIGLVGSKIDFKDATSSVYVGAVAGRIEYTNISNCYNTGEFNMSLLFGVSVYAGGIVGYSYKYNQITNCYNIGNVTAGGYKVYSGGITGYAYQTTQITNCYNIGYIVASGSSSFYKGGVIGYSANSNNEINNCYALESQGYTAVYGGGTAPSVNTGFIKTITEMMDITTYANWDFEGETSTWVMAALPYLRGITRAEDIHRILTYDYNYGALVDVVNIYTVGSNIVLPHGIRHIDLGTGYIIGWSLTESGEVDYDAGDTYIMPNENSTLYAQWIEITLFAGGEGTEINPFKIANKDQLYYLSILINDSETNSVYRSLYYELTADITFASDESEQWTPIGKDASYYFMGHFDGNEHTITNLTITSPIDGFSCYGLFGYVKGVSTSNRAEISNLGLIGTNINIIEDSSSYIGAVAGYTYYANITNCYNTGNILINILSTGFTQNYVGGISGYGGIITNCYNIGDVILIGSSSIYCNTYAGGISGCYGTITNCYNTGNVTAKSSIESFAGGIISNGGIITNCYNIGYITAVNKGGIIGYSYSSSQINNCYALKNYGYTSLYGGTAPGVITGGIKTGYEMMDISTYENWDFTGDTSIWVMAGAPLPTLRGLTRVEDICYAVIYDLNYLDSMDNFEFYRVGDNVIISNIEKIGYDFDGWALTETGEVYYNAGDIYTMLSSNITVYAKWTSYFEGGDGTEENPLQIANKEQLYNLANLVNDSTTNSIYKLLYYELTADITFAGDESEQWIPIGKNSTYYFLGYFDGNDHTIINLTTTSYISGFDYYGLFGYVKGSSSSNRATISNIGLININISITSSSDIYSGAVAGRIENANISNCYNTGNVAGTSGSPIFLGGIAGYQGNYSIVEYCYNTGNIAGNTTSGNISYTGGIVGYSYYSSVQINNSYNIGNIFSTSISSTTSNYPLAGGIAGYARSIITNCYNLGDCDATSGGSYAAAGGIVGNSTTSNQINNCYSIGNISGKWSLGGLAGRFSSTSTQINNSYALEDKGYTSVYGGGEIPSVNTGTIVTVNQMIDVATYVNWDFAGETSVWVMAGLPYLRGVTRAEDIYYSLIYDLNYEQENIAEIYKAGENFTALQRFRPNYNLEGWALTEIGAVTYTIGDVYVMPSENVTLYAQWILTNEFAGGDGTESNPLQISTKEHLYNLANYINNSDSNLTYRSLYYELIADITFASDESEQWTPIGKNSTYYFAGYFDGNDYTITNLTITSYITDFNYYGLFGYVRGVDSSNRAEISNLGLIETSINITSASYAGTVAGLSYYTNISNCYNTGDISLTSNNSSTIAGGIVSRSFYSIINDCYNSGVIFANSTSSYSYVGGISGYIDTSTQINDCINLGNISSNVDSSYFAYSGGIVGSASSSAQINNCCNSGNIISEDYSGGIVGYIYIANISNCYNIGNISSGSAAGGILGYTQNTNIINCYNTGNITGNSIGGIIGKSYYASSTTINYCYNIGNLSSSYSYKGGVLGNAQSSTGLRINYCYALIGQGYTDLLGGFSAALSVAPTGAVVSLAEMMEQTTYENWDFTGDPEQEIESVWVMAGLPYLRGVTRTVDISYVLTYDFNYELEDVVELHGATSDVTALEPIRFGYTLIGWATSESGEVEYEAGEVFAMPSANTTLYAQWVVENYTITYELNGASNDISNPNSYSYLTPTITLQPATRLGYTFIGWYDNALFSGSAIIEITEGSMGDITLYAKLTMDAYNIIYELDGGVNDLANPNIYTVETDTITLLPATKLGYTFGGWYSNAEFSGSPITEIPLGSTGDKLLYAKLTINTYTITYVLNGGTNDELNPETYDVNAGAITLQPATRLGYTFGGWYENAEFSGDAITGIPEESIGDRTFYAKFTMDTYTLTYVLDGGTNGNNPTTYDVYTATITLEPATKTGYTFDGWYDNPDLTGSAITEIPQGSTGSLTLYAKWEMDTYTITYVLNGGINGLNPTEYNIQTGITLEQATRTGYIFDGWYDNELFNGDVVTGIEVGSTGDKAFYAKWTAQTYTITYELDGGENGANPTTYTIETDTITLQPATKSGYGFAGWYDNAEFTGDAIIEIPAESTGNITIYAKWSAESYNITYILDGGTNNESNPLIYDINTPTITLLDPTKTGYTFDGWYDNSNFENDPIIEILTGSTGHRTLYAKWTIETYTITYGLDNGVNGDNPLTYDVETQTITLSDPTKTGYSFGGWYDNAEFSGSEITEILTGSTGDVTLYAEWIIETYNITYVLNGGINGENPVTYTVETETITLQSATKLGYIFEGWYNNAEFTGSEVIEIAVGSTGDKTLYAKFVIEIYNINYELDNGVNGDNPDTYTIETDTIILQPATKLGYTFVGWYDSFEFTNEVTEIILGSTGNITVYAQWTRDTYNITYNLNGGTNNELNPETYTVEDNIILQPATKIGYIFDGWYGDAVFTGSEIIEISAGNVGDKTFYAKWIAISYTITYDLNGGNAGAMNPILSIFEEYFYVSAPTRDGYSFNGWVLSGTNPDYTTALYGSTDEPNISITSSEIKAFFGTENVYFMNLSTTNNGEITLTATWGIESYYINYNLDGGTNDGSNPTIYDVNTPTITLLDPTKTGYIFDGWYDSVTFDNEITEIITGSTGNKTFYAKWIKDTYTIAYVLNDGMNDELNPSTYDVETETITLLPATKSGYTFDGWYNNAEFTGSAITQIQKGSTGDITLYAKLTKDTYTITYVLNGGINDILNPTTYEVDSDTLTILPASKLGYTFDSWYNNAEFTGSEITEITTGSTGNLTLYAKFNAIEFTVTYDENGALPIEDTIFTIATDTFNLSNIARLNYAFDGWKVITVDENVYVSDGVLAQIDEFITQIYTGSYGNIEVQAQWTRVVYFEEGNGSETTPYEVENKEQLYNLASLINSPATTEAYRSLYYILTADIEFDGSEQWTPIGKDDSIYFAGGFDGNGHIISNLTITSVITDFDTYGLFGYVKGTSENPVEIINLGLVNININLNGSLDNSYLGGIAGRVEYAEVSSCYTTGNITVGFSSDVNAGGMIGYADSLNLSNCYNELNITANNSLSAYIGGVVGYSYQLTQITDCYNIGQISTSSIYKGGIIGYVEVSSEINNCYALENKGYDELKNGNANVTGDLLSLTEMINQSSYENWDFEGDTSIWLMEGLPYLRGVTRTEDIYYILTYSLNYEGTTDIVEIYTTGTEITLSTKTRTGYIFAGWALIESGDVVYSAGETYTMPSESATLYAKWTAISYSIIYNLNSGIEGVNNPEISNFGETFYVSAPTRLGYTFTGWTLSGINKDYTTALYGSTSETDIAITSGIIKAFIDENSDVYFKNLSTTNNGSIILTANWTLTEYTISYNLNGGTNNENNPSTYTFISTTINLLPATKTGSSFSGWYNNPVFNGSPVAEITTGTTGDITLYAKWSNYFAGGNGTEESPFQISNKVQLYTFANLINNSSTNSSYNTLYYQLTANIIFANDESEQWTPIGINSTYYFAGTFNGNNYTITNLTMTASILGFNSYGLFGYVNGESENTAEISNIGFINIKADLTLNSSLYLGAVAGYVSYTDILNCYNTGLIVINATNSNSYVGGLVGYTNNTSQIEDCYNTANIEAEGISTFIGGILAYSNGTVIINDCYNIGELTINPVGSYSYAGGIAGRVYNLSEINNCYNTANIIAESTNSAYSFSGGIVGRSYESIKITNCYNAGSVTASLATLYSYAGGITGSIINDSQIINCYNIGDIEAISTSIANANAGGVAGNASNMEITNCYNVGTVSASGSSKGGIIGNSSVTEINNCYALENKGYADIYGIGDYLVNTGAILTLEEMVEESSYENWNFTSVWEMAGLPYLRDITKTENIHFKLVYNLNYDESEEDIIKVYFAGSEETIIEGTRVGYNFIGWSTTESGEVVYSVDELYTMPDENVTLYAQWTPIVYTISYELNGGVSNSNNPTSYTIETDTLMIETTSKIGYMFIGWYDNPEFNGDAIIEIQTGSIGNVTLYAEWRILTFDVDFLDYYGNELDLPSQEVDYGSLVQVPNDPEKGNCTFEGWYIDTEFENEYDFDTPVTEYLVLYAKFSVDATLIVDNSTISRRFTLGNLLSSLSTVESTKEGYSISGWTYEDEVLTEEIELDLEESIVFEAILVANTYSISFDLNYEDNEDVIDPQEVVFDEEIGELPEPTRKGCIFLGWYYEEMLIESTDVFEIPEDITLVASWEIIRLDFTWIYIGSGIAVFFITFFIVLIFKKIAKMRRYERTSKLNMLKRKIR